MSEPDKNSIPDRQHTAELLREATFADIRSAPTFAEIDSPQWPEGLEPASRIDCRADSALVEWFRRNCGGYRVSFGDFVVGALMELRGEHDSEQLAQRVEVFRDQGQLSPLPRSALGIRISDELHAWVIDLADELSLETEHVVDIALRSRQDYCVARGSSRMKRFTNRRRSGAGAALQLHSRGSPYPRTSPLTRGAFANGLKSERSRPLLAPRHCRLHGRRRDSEFASDLSPGHTDRPKLNRVRNLLRCEAVIAKSDASTLQHTGDRRAMKPEAISELVR